MKKKVDEFFRRIKKVKFKDTIRFYIWIILYVLAFWGIYTSFRGLYIETLHYKSSEAANEINESFDKYLIKVDSTVKSCTAAVEYMMDMGKSVEDIQKYIEYETEKLGIVSKSGVRGIFGLIDGTYVTGVEWHPNSDYDPTHRIWYTEAVKNDGEYALVGPYFNLRTYEYVITECKLLDDKKSVIAFAIDYDTFNDLTIKMANSDAAQTVLIMNKEGIVLASSDSEEMALDYTKSNDPFKQALYEAIKAHRDDDTFELSGGGRFKGDYIIAQKKMLYGLSVISVIDAKEELGDLLRTTIIYGCAVFLGLLLVIFFNFRRLVKDVDEKEREENLKAVANIYASMYRVDMEQDTFEKIMNSEYKVKQLIGDDKRASVTIKHVMESMADDRSRAEVLEFVDLSTLNQRMKTTDSISIEYLNYEHIWHRLKFIVIDRDKENNLRNIIFASELIDDEKRARDRFQYLAETDQLTGINNRGTGENKIKDLLFRDVGGMFILFDADHFKYVNDNFGHDVGDEVLIGIAEAMKHTFREKDILMRLGGDEFAAYTPGIFNEEAARHVLDRFINAVENMDIKKLNGHKISISIGAAFYFATDSFSFDELYSRADTCAYVSKKIEGSEVTFYKRKGTL